MNQDSGPMGRVRLGETRKHAGCPWVPSLLGSLPGFPPGFPGFRSLGSAPALNNRRTDTEQRPNAGAPPAPAISKPQA